MSTGGPFGAASGNRCDLSRYTIGELGERTQNAAKKSAQEELFSVRDPSD